MASYKALNTNRDVSIDIMRGIGILSMLVGHCVIPDLLHKFIYMWHMPLFFIASGYFFRRTGDRSLSHIIIQH